eukprot:443173-Ditylum_brightwellii.AAC.1
MDIKDRVAYANEVAMTSIAMANIHMKERAVATTTAPGIAGTLTQPTIANTSTTQLTKTSVWESNAEGDCGGDDTSPPLSPGVIEEEVDLTDVTGATTEENAPSCSGEQQQRQPNHTMPPQ